MTSRVSLAGKLLLGLPDMDGTEVIAGLRGWTDVSILVLSGRTDSLDKVDALDVGTDDYVTKPFGMDELLARLRAMTRRGGNEEQPFVRFGDATVDLGGTSRHQGWGRRTTHTDGVAPPEVLMRNPGKPAQSTPAAD